LLNAADSENRFAVRATGEQILSALDDHIAVLDRQGNIIQVNESWKRFAQNNGAPPRFTGLGSNYLEVCRGSLEMCPANKPILAGIQAVMDGTAPHFRFEYRCDSRTEERWFELRVNRLPDPEGGAVVCHSDISALSKVRDEYSAVLDGAEAILWRAKLPDFEPTFVSKHVETILGYPVNNWLAQQGFWREHIHPEDRDWVLALTTRATQAQRSHDFEYRMIAANGQTIWFRTIVNVFAEKGVATEMVAVSVDISARKHVEEELRRSNMQLKTTIDSITDGLLIMDHEWRYTFFSERAARIVGVEREDMLGRVVWDLFPHAKGTKFYEGYHKAVQTGESQHFEEYYPEPLNLWLECHCYPSKEGLAVYFHYVTDRNRAAEALRKSEEQFRRVVEHIGDALFMDDVDGRVVFANERFLKLFGFERDELPGVRLQDYVAPEYRALWRESHQRRMSAEPVPTHFEYEGLRRDGTRIWLEVEVVPVAGAQGKPIGTQSALRDITERKRAEDALANLSGRLIEAQEEERRRVARELHDDYNQRLAMLGIGLQSLAKDIGEASPEAGQQLHDLFNRVSGLSEDMHSLSHRLHSSTLENLGLVAGVKAFCKEFRQQQSIQVDFVHDNVPRDIPGDAALCMFRIVQEALRNIKKHSGADRAEVRLVWSGERLQLSVSDQGRGFEPKKPPAERGIGIRSMEERLRILGGQLEVHSQAMVGTRIEASLPFHEAA